MSPVISVIIATRNRCESLREVLADVAGQVTERRFAYDVIVADNGSTDRTRAVVEALQPTYPVPLTYVCERRPGKAHALNRALAAAAGGIVAFTDDDVKLDPRWLATIEETFQHEQADGVGGPVHPFWIGARPRWLGDRLLRQLGMADHGPEAFVASSLASPFIGPNCAYRKSLFERHGGFNAEPGCAEDAEWFRRVVQAGHRLVYQPEAVVVHKIDGDGLTKRAIAQRFFRHGRSCAMALQRKRAGRALCRVPWWVIRLSVDLHWQAAASWLRGNHQEAVYHWLQRHYYFGIMAGCFSDWRKRTPLRPAPIPTIIPQEIRP